MGFFSSGGHRRVGGSVRGGRWGCTGEWVHFIRYIYNLRCCSQNWFSKIHAWITHSVYWCCLVIIPLCFIHYDHLCSQENKFILVYYYVILMEIVAGWLINGPTVRVSHSLIVFVWMPVPVSCAVTLWYLCILAGCSITFFSVFLVFEKVILTFPASDGWINNVCRENRWNCVCMMV